MTRRRPWSSLIGLLAFSMFPIFGAACGSLLGIEEPTDRDASLARDVTSESALMCTSGQKSCSGICVAKNDPSVGCGEGCSACAGGANAVPSCDLKSDVFRCGVTCNPGFGNCDGKSAGCTAQLNTATFCGSCTNNCRADGGKDFCVSGKGTPPSCSPTCPSPNVDCRSECVDPMTNPTACGPSCKDCTLANGAGTCEFGVCKVSSVCAGTDISCGPPAGPCVNCSPERCLSGLCSVSLDAGGTDGGCIVGTSANCAMCGNNCFAEPCCTVGGVRSCGYPEGGTEAGLPFCVL